MNRLFIRLYLDEDVSVLIKRILVSRGHDVVTTVDEGKLSESDAAQLAFAAENERVIVTHNHGDFEKLASEYIAAGRSHCGIIVAYRRRPSEIAERLLRLLDSVTADEICNQLRYI